MSTSTTGPPAPPPVPPELRDPATGLIAPHPQRPRDSATHQLEFAASEMSFPQPRYSGQQPPYLPQQPPRPPSGPGAPSPRMPSPGARTPRVGSLPSAQFSQPPPHAQFDQLSLNSGPGPQPYPHQHPRAASYGPTSPHPQPQPPGGWRATSLGVPPNLGRGSTGTSSQASSAASSASVQHDGSRLCITLPTISDLSVMHDSAAASGVFLDLPSRHFCEAKRTLERRSYGPCQVFKGCAQAYRADSGFAASGDAHHECYPCWLDR
jgi:hypothetical protein